MRTAIKVLVLILGIQVFTVFHVPVFAQLSTIGREFFVGFMENNRIVPNRMDQATIIISAAENANGFIQYATGTHLFSIQAGEQYVYDFPKDGLDVIHRTSGQVEDLGIYIFSDGNIAVHAFNFRERSADGTVVLPLSSLGKEYILTAHHEEFAPGVNPGSNVNYESTMLIVAVENDTYIEIVTTAPTVNTIPPGAPINITLQKGQSYQIKAKGDLTGTRVRVLGSQEGDCKNIAVFGGNKMTAVGRDCEGTTGDHLFQQAYPVFSWGMEYIHIPFRGRSSGEMVKVLASDDNTEVFINGVSQGRINRGKFLTFNFGENEIVNIKGSRPIAVTTFAKSQWCNIQNGPYASNGDPTMVTLSPNNQMIKNVAFSAVKVVGIVNHYLNVIAKRGTESQTVLDGVAVGSEFSPVPGNPDYSYARIEIKEGVHTLSNAEGIIGYVYGSGFIESYGYSAGASLANLNFKTEVEYDFEVEGDKVACLDKIGTWNVIPFDPKFQIFEWTFGDGTPMQEGKVVDHQFEKPGKYEIRITAFTGDRACDQIQEAIFEVEVIETQGALEGPDTVCPLIDEATYTFENIQNTAKVRWEVTGGQIVQASDFTAQIKWGAPNPNARIVAYPLTKEGCEGEPSEIKVLITESIQPGAPKGKAQICFGEAETFVYQVKDILPNRGYEWFVTGGEILSGQSTSDVVVEWGGIGSIGEIGYREFSLENPTCDGFSTKLPTKVNPPMVSSLKSMTTEICEGSTFGRIEIESTGGTGQFTYKWSHNDILNSPVAEGLPIGKYSVTITDMGGCEVVVEGLEIKASAPFQLRKGPIVTDASCFDSNDGIVLFEVGGGTMPYRINGFQYTISGTSIEIRNLPRGQYDFEVIDAVGCSLSVVASIESPETLSVSFDIERFACGGLANGTLLSIPKGGVSPYILSWEMDASSDVRLTNIASGRYGLLIEDQNGCQLRAFGEMRDGAPVLRMPSGFNPSDGKFKGVSNCQITFELWIYNKWGQLVYTGADGWDGKIREQEAPAGTYTFMIEYAFEIDGKKEKLQQRGAFTLVR
jgi:hypothetical protein